MIIDTTYKNLLAALKQPGCPVCRMEQLAVEEFFRTSFRENATNLMYRQGLRESLGFCREHAWRMLNLGFGNTMAAALGYHDVLLEAVQQLQNANLVSPPARRFRFFRRRSRRPVTKSEAAVHALIPKERCPACRFCENYTRSVLSTLEEALHDQTIVGALAGSDGLCLAHLRQAFDRIQDDEICAILIATNVERFEALRRGLTQAIRQAEQNKGRKIAPGEDDLWRKVITAISGDRW